MAGQGMLLPDLAFRLTAVRFAIPPLRQRREDIASLAQSLLDRICLRYQQRPVILGPGTLARLLQHNWPGNVRELASVLETALLEAENGVIRPDDLALPITPEMQLGMLPDLHSASQTDNLSLDAMIRHHVQYVLDLNRGNKLRAARQLCISRSTLYRILGNETILAH
jgi:two-component system response regulator AtoC